MSELLFYVCIRPRSALLCLGPLSLATALWIYLLGGCPLAHLQPWCPWCLLYWAVSCYLGLHHVLQSASAVILPHGSLLLESRILIRYVYQSWRSVAYILGIVYSSPSVMPGGRFSWLSSLNGLWYQPSSRGALWVDKGGWLGVQFSHLATLILLLAHWLSWI